MKNFQGKSWFGKKTPHLESLKTFAQHLQQMEQGNGKERGELGEEEWQLKDGWEWQCLRFRYSTLRNEKSMNTISSKLGEQHTF